jgi:hypothetical protein
MNAADIFQVIGERFGLLPVYALVIGAAGFSASSLRHLLTVLVMLAGLYITMFQAFDLKQGLDVFGLAERFGLNADIGNGVVAVIYVFGIGVAVYGVKRMFVRKPRAAKQDPDEAE